MNNIQSIVGVNYHQHNKTRLGYTCIFYEKCLCILNCIILCLVASNFRGIAFLVNFELSEMYIVC